MWLHFPCKGRKRNNYRNCSFLQVKRISNYPTLPQDPNQNRGRYDVSISLFKESSLRLQVLLRWVNLVLSWWHKYFLVFLVLFCRFIFALLQKTNKQTKWMEARLKHGHLGKSKKQEKHTVCLLKAWDIEFTKRLQRELYLAVFSINTIFLYVRLRTQPIWDTYLSWVWTLISAWALSILLKRDYSPESLSTVSSQGAMVSCL